MEFQESNSSVSLGLELRTGYVESSNYVGRAGVLKVKKHVTSPFSLSRSAFKNFNQMYAVNSTLGTYRSTQMMIMAHKRKMPNPFPLCHVTDSNNFGRMVFAMLEKHMYTPVSTSRVLNRASAFISHLWIWYTWGHLNPQKWCAWDKMREDLNKLTLHIIILIKNGS